MTRSRSSIAALFAAILIASAPALAQSDSVKEVQNALLMMGMFTGKPDGQMNDRTSTGLQKFQQANGLPVTGKLDERTLGAIRAKRDSQFQGSLAAPTPQAQRERAQAVEPKPQAGPAKDSVGTSALSGTVNPGAIGGGALGTAGSGPAPRGFTTGGGSSTMSSSGSYTIPGSTSGGEESGFEPAMLTWAGVPVVVGIVGWVIWMGFGFGARRRGPNPYLAGAGAGAATGVPGAAPRRGRREPTL